MAIGRPKTRLIVSPSEHKRLDEWSRGRKTAQALALQAGKMLVSRSNLACRNKWLTSGTNVSSIDGLLDEPRPGAPRRSPMMKLGQPERRTHHYVRDGTTSRFAALNVATGEVIGKRRRRNRLLEFGKYLKTIDAQVLKHLDVHLIMDNYATHKTSAIRRRLAKRPRFHVHFTPTSASWINLLEGRFPRSPRNSSAGAQSGYE